ncbi:MAG: DUF91 domain-containing protein [Spirochaetaceae bacterium]|nr:DUF91 domain-containing protein [Spirochaetaceae bacterium]
MENKESAVVKEVKEILSLTGLAVQRINSGAFVVDKRYIRAAAKGTLDFEGYDNNGRFLAIECKRRDGGSLSAEQAKRIKDINRKGGVAIVVRSGSECYELLKEKGCL